MKTIKKLNKWANHHNPLYVLDIMRVFLGSFLFLKGFHFMSDAENLKSLVAPSNGFLSSMFIYQYVTMAHLSGGALIIFGLLTRLAIGMQIPILIGAVAINFTIAMNVSNFIQAAFILVLAVFFIIVGSGKHSADYNLKMQL